MNKKTVFGLTLLVSMAVLLNGCGNVFTSKTKEGVSVWEAKKISSLLSGRLTELPFTEKAKGKEITIEKVFLCFHSNGKAYRKFIGKGFDTGKPVFIEVGKPYSINKADKKITIGGDVYSYILKNDELTIQNEFQIFGVYKLSSEPEFTN